MIERHRNVPRRIKVTERERILLLGLPLTSNTYTLTNKKITIKKGLANTEEEDIPLYRIKNLRLTRSFRQRLAGVGTIEVTTADKLSPDFEIRNIKNFRIYKELMEENIEYERERNVIRLYKTYDASYSLEKSAKRMPILSFIVGLIALIFVGLTDGWLFLRRYLYLALNSLKNTKQERHRIRKLNKILKSVDYDEYELKTNFKTVYTNNILKEDTELLSPINKSDINKEE